MIENLNIKKTPKQVLLEARVGLWSATGLTIASSMFLIALVVTFVIFPLNFNWQGIEVYAQSFTQHYWQILMFVIPCFLIAPLYLILTVAIHRFAPEEKHILSLLGIVFAVAYVAQITANYYLQMSAISQSISSGLLDGTTLFAFGNLNSIFWSMEILGYTWLSMSMIFTGLLFSDGKMETTIKWIFMVNGILGVVAIIQAVTHLDFGFPFSLVLFAFTFPVATAMMALLFHRVSKKDNKLTSQ
ncbi:MAG: hypothetical protein ACC609_07145 [Methanobacterium formicicum]